MKLLWRLAFSNSVPGYRLMRRFAFITITIAIAAIHIAWSIAQAFEKNIVSKLTAFVGQIQITAYLPEATDSIVPIPYPLQAVEQLKNQLESRLQVTPYVQIAGLARGAEGNEPIVVKGVHQWKKNLFPLVKGRYPDFHSNKKEILISELLARRLKVDTGAKLITYFLSRQGKIKARAFKITGIYQTYLYELDEQMTFAPLRVVQRLLRLDSSEVEGYELLFPYAMDSKALQEKARIVNRMIPHDLQARSAFERFPHLFEWLHMQKQNTHFIFLLMWIVVFMNLASTLLIFILERSNHFGLLKALGATRKQLQRWILGIGSLLYVQGWFWGSLLAIVLLFIQQQWKLIRLNPEMYFIDSVPVSWDFMAFLVIDILFYFALMVALVLPTWFVRRLSAADLLRRQ